MSAAAGTIYRFGEYELTLVPLALSRRGIPVKVRSQPLQLLALLASHSGELVTHEEIRRALWNRRIVDFSRSVHVCVGQLRAALGDEVAQPRYVETVPRQGYRLLVPVERLIAPTDVPAAPRGRARRAMRPAALAAAIAVSVALAGLALFVTLRDQHVPAAVDSARDAYLRGKHLLGTGGRDNVAKSVRYFVNALAENPALAEAHVSLAEAHRLLGAPADAKLHAAKAVSLAPSSAEAHAQMAMSVMQADWDWERAGHHVERALMLDPGSSLAHEAAAARHAILGDLPAALAEMKLALAIDPVSTLLRADYGWLHYFHGDNDAAIRRCGEALDLDPRHLASLLCVERAAEAKADHTLARDTALRIMRLWRARPDELAAIGALAAVEVPRAYHEWRLRFFSTYPDQSVILPEDLADVNAALGNYEVALVELERAAVARSPALPFLLTDPIFTPLHADARFAAVRARLNLAPAATGG